MNFKWAYQITLCTLVATIFSLTTHIYVMKWLQPYVDIIISNCVQQGINFNPDPSTYSWLVVTAAYITAYMMIGVYVLLYYHAQHIIPGKNKLTKWFFLTLIIFGIKGDLIRQPIMNFIVSYESMSLYTSLIFVVLNHLDKWIANIFLAFFLVYFCPKNNSDLM